MAQTIRVSTAMDLREPIRSITRSCKKRSSLTCKGRGMSPTSSRNSVPPAASSILPSVVLTAPVKAPFSCPNSSLSSRFSGMAAQLIATKAPPRRSLASCRPRASNSLPVPLAPSSMTETLVLATRSIVRATLTISGAAVISRPSTRWSSPTFSASLRFAASIWCNCSARRTIRPSVSISTGFW